MLYLEEALVRLHSILKWEDFEGKALRLGSSFS
jgi:hypothetical protein